MAPFDVDLGLRQALAVREGASLSTARRLRGELTASEQALWRLLRDRRFMGTKFRRQHSFGPYVVDFYCPSANLVIELDGDSHFNDAQQVRDRERRTFIEQRFGVRFVRLVSAAIFQNREGMLELLLVEVQRTE